MFSRHGRKRSGAHRADHPEPTPQVERVVDPGSPDDMYPHLSRERADLLREETMRFLHEEGFDTSWRPDGYIAARPEGTPDASPRLVGLDNLSLQIANAAEDAPPEELTEFIRNFVSTVVTDVDVDNIPDADFLRQLKARLVSAEALESITDTADDSSTPPVPPTFADASHDFAGDLRVALVLDTPASVMTLNDDSLAAHGTASHTELDDLFRVGYRNTWQELVDAKVDTNPIKGEEPGARFWVIESETFFLASAPLFLDELLTRWVPQVDTSEGVIVALPHRHLMLVREVSTGHDLLEGINTMTSVALTQFSDNPGPLSPRLHLSHNGDFTAFTDISTNDDGQRVLQVFPDDHLMARLNDGGGIDDIDTGDTDGDED
ncbi:MAG: hypothetical protein ACTIL2_09650 [Corynebacterium sp.]|uniref:hypothetical protein n=1 Tax=Corynebacterium sp. TaxID=1720 RepID=UPI003F9643F5